MLLLFHTDVYMPERIRLSTGELLKLVEPNLQGRMKVSYHASRAAQTDRYGLIDIPEYFDARKAKLIEVEVDHAAGKVTKRVYRQKYDEHHDLVLVITDKWVLKTVWLNCRGDAHRTLDASKYVPNPGRVH
ncbi:pyridoxamine 5'-phosphate oxidase [Novimethylophilus kurashikiensis]|uniref:Pyridoxamine 5'-phosphate oxidase n=1 Tax=Novimethylophilus kurashikiensis TaxID=1825523 RepID=A0A2R5FED2_9PROT|nr:hypothetical protein [Novimethylophilus kurashikiensis]GBG14824.1 pyridoxamine 5'-phosphate oxidase [Novimethylophilus kurashikiensis]